MRSVAATLALVSTLLATPAAAQAVRIVHVQRREGTGDTGAFRRGVENAAPQLTRCRVARGGRADGRLEIVVAIDPAHPAHEVTLVRRSFDPAPALEACLARVLARVRVAPPDTRTAFSIRLALPAAPPERSDERPATDAARAEVARAGSEARHLARATRRLHRLLAAAERAGPAARARLAPRIARARLVLALWSGLDALLAAEPVQFVGVDPCRTCLLDETGRAAR